jgi:mRNA-degrading endonuclease RelE of RelBE toxin-antitoxin system
MQKDIKLTYLKRATKFLNKNKHIIQEGDIDKLIILAIRKKIFLEKNSLDIKELKGILKGKSRIRKGKIRIIFSIQENEVLIESIIEDIDFRGNIY